MNDDFVAEQLALPGLILLTPKIRQDERGAFVKTFHKDKFSELGLHFIVREEYFSTSKQHVLRGMHFQEPPYDVDKLVYCIDGTILDVILDIRRGSPTYGQACQVELSSVNRLMLFIPTGFAHGFYTVSPSATMVYKTSVVYQPSHDKGVHWQSVPNWMLTGKPLLSPRDEQHPLLEDYDSPFVYQELSS